MSEHYEIRQKIRNVNKSWLDVIFKTEGKITALLSYQELVDDYPDEYFELIKVIIEEEYIEFTTKKFLRE